MRRLCICLMLVISITLLSTNFVIAASAPSIKNGILKYNAKSVDLNVYDFNDTANGFYIPGGVLGSGLYYKPQLMGDYIYLIGTIFIPQDVDFNDSGSFKNQKVQVGTIYTCIWRFDIKSDDLKPWLIGHFVTRESWTCPYTTDINEGNDDKTGTTKVTYAWGKGLLIPQLITSQYRKDTMYMAAESYDPVVKADVYMFSYLTRQQLEASNGKSTQIFYVKYSGLRPTGGEPGAWGFHEKNANTITVTSFPKGYKGDQLFWDINIGVPTQPKVVSTWKTNMN